ncbi:uncharacterized protein BYT42DRAFT_551620 [Radiomyces spectabilis]|uniref:uncharacterized protein n=1 Tax=Radiomyces spectabilis TaxID=64574 RepID=UPI00221F91F0|nr:uncharacterized protein BYT42DRAFT_551620 [Radiomyces spectabilis]KAI8393603.1 hypothetical protein BYT42DRAFT_551620 [Radiomyces spectabilis]
MKVYRAETGQQINWRSTALDTFRTLDDLKKELERCTGVPADSQILMTSYGTQVRQDQFSDVLHATGQDEYIVFCYDRHYLGSSPEEIATLLDVETPTLEPKVPPFDALRALQALNHKRSIEKLTVSQSCELYLSLFSSFDVYCQSLIKTANLHTQLAQTIVTEQKSQTMALNVALTNLESHNRFAKQGIQTLFTAADKELARHTALLDAVNIDLSILRHIQIHPQILQHINDPEIVKGQGRLVHFINDAAIEHVKDDTLKRCDHLTAELQELRNLASDLEAWESDLHRQMAEDHDLQSLDTTLSDIQEMLNKAQFLRDKIKRDLGRIYSKISELLNIPLQSLLSSLTLNTTAAHARNINSSPSTNGLSSHAKKTLEAFSHLAEIHVRDYLPKLSDYEASIRQRVNDLAWKKRCAIESFLKNMNTVSQLQSEIAAVTPRLETANKDLSELKQTNGHHGLESPRELLFAYGALLIELVRRNEYMKLLIQNADMVADLLARYRDQEEKRRQTFRHDIAPILPFNFVALEDSASHCEISTICAKSKYPEIERDDILDYITLLSQFYGHSAFSKISKAKGKSLYQSTSMDQSTPLRSKSKRWLNGDNFLSVLHDMNKKLDGLKVDFLKDVQDMFSIPQPPKSMGGTSRRMVSPLADSVSPIHASYNAENQLKDYEAKIASLERTLQKNLNMTPELRSKDADEGDRFTVSSNDSFAYSVVEGGKDKILDIGHSPSPTDKDQLIAQMKKEIQQLQDTVYQRETFINKMHGQLIEEQEKADAYRVQNEHEKEDMRLQIQELEQLLDEERQTYEENRKSLLKEAQIKDNLADIRIASVEDELRGRMQDVLEEHKRTCEKLKAKHYEEIQDLKRAHQEEMEEFNDRLRIELEQRQIMETQLQAVRQEKNDLDMQLTRVQSDHDAITQQAAAEKIEMENKIQMLSLEKGNSEQAREDIKQRLAQAREMVAKAENDWMEKQKWLEEMMAGQEAIRTAVIELWDKHLDRSVNGDIDILTLLQEFDQALHKQTKESRHDHDSKRSPPPAMLQGIEYAEAYQLAIRMAQKLEEFIIFIIKELIEQLQLPGSHIGVSDSLEPLPNFDIAACEMIMDAANAIDHKLFVSSVGKSIREARDYNRRWQKEYKQLKEKYNKLVVTTHEKIAFRNFKVGDVALFLPTRSNTSGKPWAAFNINAPYYFLKPSESVIGQMQTDEWIVARITSITECVVTFQDPETNPYGLADGATFFQLDVEHWRHSRQRAYRKLHRHEKQKEEAASAPPPKPASQHWSSVQHPIPLSKAISTDTGLASIRKEISSTETMSPSSLPDTSRSNINRNPFSLSLSTSNIVHSYIPSISPTAKNQERRRSTGYFQSPSTLPVEPYSVPEQI